MPDKQLLSVGVFAWLRKTGALFGPGLALLALLTVVRAQPAEEARSDDVPLRHELSFELRRELPEVKLTLWHVAEERDQRWAKINGERLAEGGLLESGLSVVAVRRDGVVCEYRGQRFLLTPN